jgi:hypothetical protein
MLGSTFIQRSLRKVDLFVFDDIHRDATSVPPLLLDDLALQLLKWEPLQVPLGIDSRLDHNVGLIRHSARQGDDLLEREGPVDPLLALASLPIRGMQTGAGVPHIDAPSDFLDVLLHFYKGGSNS